MNYESFSIFLFTVLSSPLNHRPSKVHPLPQPIDEGAGPTPTPGDGPRAAPQFQDVAVHPNFRGLRFRDANGNFREITRDFQGLLGYNGAIIGINENGNFHAIYMYYPILNSNIMVGVNLISGIRRPLREDELTFLTETQQ